MADYYGTVAGYKTYHGARGNTYTDDATAIEAALLRASPYVDAQGVVQCKPGGVVQTLWPGTKAGGRTQLRAWPRVGATDNNGDAIDPGTVPVEVEYATYEAALIEQTTPGSTSPGYTPGSAIKREKIDVIETEYAVSNADGVASVRPIYSAVLDLLAPLLMSACGGFAIEVV